MAETPDNSTLILAESYANRLTAFDIEVDGGLSNRRVWSEDTAGEARTGRVLTVEVTIRCRLALILQPPDRDRLQHLLVSTSCRPGRD
jgi:hypothetical protein